MTGPFVDTHVIHLEGIRPEWWQACRASLENEPLQLHVIDGFKGHIGRGRAKGFAMGSAPYVSCVDPDDLVVPGAFAACIKALEAHPEACGAYTDEYLIDPAGDIIRPGIWSGRPWNPLLQLEPKYLHHIYVMRREFVDRHLDELHSWPNLPEFVLKGLLCRHGPWVHVNRFGYKWRVHEESPSHKRFPLMGLYAARWRIIPILQQAAALYRATLVPFVDDHETRSTSTSNGRARLVK